MPIRPPGEGSRIVRVLRDCGVEQPFRHLEDGARRIVHVLLGAQKEFVSLEAFRPLDADTIHFCRVQVRRDLSNNHFGQAVLHLEEIGKSLVEL
jgi:hypothetical protein